jgi:GNAT superfamily N-acetyltransferase
MNHEIVFAKESDVPEILNFIRELARYEKLEHQVSATEAQLRESLFGPHKHAEVIFLNVGAERAGFALFFHNFSTFLGKPGIYLEDLYVKPEHRGKGYGKKLLAFLARLALERKCGRLEWWVLDWNKPAIDFYISLGSEPMADWTVHRVAGESLTRMASMT